MIWRSVLLLGAIGVECGCAAVPGAAPQPQSMAHDSSRAARIAKQASRQIDRPAHANASTEKPTGTSIQMASHEAASPEGSARIATASDSTFETSDAGLPPSADSSAAMIGRSRVDVQSPDGRTFRIDLATALHRTGGQSPQVAFAQARIRESLARLEQADTFWLPSLRGGLNYNKHEGRIQDVAGNVFETSRNAFYTGFGANAVGAASPTVPGIYANFHLADAVFQPRIAAESVSAQQSAGQSVTNDELLNTAVAYLELLRAGQEIAIAEETLDNSRKLAELTGSYARSGQGLESDFDRARTEVALRTNDLLRAQESQAVASARLARQLHLDPTCRLEPSDPFAAPIELISPGRSATDLVSEGLSRRPETAESRHLVAEACERLRREKYAPLIPSILLGVSYGGFGGGLGGDVNNFGSRFDADAVAYWEVRNLGFGEQAARSLAGSRIDQARMRSLVVLDRVAGEIVEAHAQVEARRRQVDVARDATAAAISSHKRNLDRIQNAQGLPIETLQSIQALAITRREYLRALMDHNEAQFRLQRALGWPDDSR